VFGSDATLVIHELVLGKEGAQLVDGSKALNFTVPGTALTQQVDGAVGGRVGGSAIYAVAFEQHGALVEGLYTDASPCCAIGREERPAPGARSSNDLVVEELPVRIGVLLVVEPQANL